MNHLNDIAVRQRSTRVRDAVFAAFVALGLMMSVATIGTAAQAASTHAPAATAARLASR
jgi:hypothetical protein